MKRTVKLVSIISLVLTLFFTVLHAISSNAVILSLAITCGTTAYHFIMRLAVGHIVDLILDNHVDYNKPWFHSHQVESKLYELLRVKHWKANMPSYDPSLFSPALHSYDEIAQAMCQAEIVHEIIAVLSFVPLLFVGIFGSFPVFLITSVLSACFDMSFVVMQRYNRPRIIKIIEKTRKNQ